MFPRASMLIRIAPHADGASSGAGDAYAPRECCRAAGAELAAEGRGVWHKHEGLYNARLHRHHRIRYAQ